MTREELLRQINLSEELIAKLRPNRQATIIRPTYITIHNTSNANAGADANAHSGFVRNVGYYILRDNSGNESKNWVSWHFTVDDKRAIRQLPSNEKALHAGTVGNNSSIGIEICMHAGINQEAANFRAAQLVALLCLDLSISLDNVVAHHYWTKKNCPQLLLRSWDDFMNKIARYYNELSAAPNFENESMKLHLSETTSLISEDSNCWSELSSEDLTYETDFLNSSQLNITQNCFNEKFLENGVVQLPVLDKNHPQHQQQIFLHHQNLSIYYNQERHLALYTACNFDKEKLIPMQRSNAFRDDPFLPSALQLNEGFYLSKTLDATSKSNYFDRGHIIARRYNQWGESIEEAKSGEKDTYYFTTIYPQVGELNKDEWEKLESFIIDQGKLDVKKVSIIAGTFLKVDDPIATYIDKFYQEEKAIQIPRLFWKIVYYEVNKELRKISFLMSQVNRLKQLSFVKFKETDRYISDPFEKLDNSLKTYIINSSIVEEHTKLIFPKAKELYQETEPFEVVMMDNETLVENETDRNIWPRVNSNISGYI